VAAFQTIQVDISDAVAVITLNRPEVINAYSVRMRDELWEVLSNLAADPELRVLGIRGAGRGFCSGADLREFGTAPSPFVARRIRFLRDVWGALRSFPVPTVALLHGPVIGTGFELALHCTLRIAGESTFVRMPEARLGVLPGAGGTQTIVRASSPTVAGRLLYLGAIANVRELRQAGLVDQVVSDEELDSAFRRMAAWLAEPEPAVVAAVLSLLRARDECSTAEAVRFECALGRSLSAQSTSRSAMA
jgi:enoyl-CoA hydratase/carnithine racemase